MREFDAGQFDIAVIGAGHAGIEAALAAARLGLETVCLTINLDAVGNMPCNPAIGGTAKGHLVRELDALGGEMARAADRACIQYRMLNRRKGPAVWSLRAQADRRAYQQVMKHTLEMQEHLTLRQAEAVALRTENGRVTGVVLRTGAVYRVRAVVLCTGITQIRPLLYCREDDIRRVARRLELPVVHNPCPANGHSRRQEVKELIAGLEGRYPDIKQKLFGSLQRYPLYGWNLHEEER